jgi:hypothetical protein
MKWSFLVVGIVLTLVFAVIQLPTRYALTLLPSLPALSLSEPTGTLWQGGVCATTDMLPEKACAHWHWQFDGLFSANLVWDVFANVGDVKTQSLVRTSTAAWQVSGTLQAPAGQAIPQWAALLPAGKTATEKKIDFSGRW